MAQYLITDSLLNALADSVSTKTGAAKPLTIEDMADAVDGITSRTASDLTASGDTVTVPAGLYAAQATKSVATGTAGTPTASKGAVSNHSVNVTPSVTNTAGYITGGTKTGTAVNVTASELVSGTKSITANGTGIDVTNYAAVDVSVSGGGVNLQTKSKTYTPTTSQQTESVTADQGYDGLAAVNVTVDAVTPAVIAGSAGMIYGAPTITVDNSGLVYSTWNNFSNPSSVSPISQDGWATTADTTVVYGEVTGSLQLTTQAAQTIYPSTSDQTINASRYLTGTQTIKGVAVSNTLTADNIKNGVTITIGDSADADRITSVTGTYTGGGTSKNAQVVQQNATRVTATTYTKACGDITVSKTGTYDVYWTAYRTSTSGTWGTQLYINSAAYGTAQTTFNSYYQAIHLSNISLTANQTVAVYGRSRGSNYYLYVGQLTIIEA